MKYWPIIFLFLLTILLRLPSSLSEPYWYGDEGVTLTASRVINQGGILYKDIDDNKPPLLYFLGAAAGGELKPFKTLTLFWSLLTIAIFYLLSKLILSKRLAFLSSLVFVFLANTPILEGNIINGEIYFILPTTLSAYLIMKSVIARNAVTKQSHRKNVEIATSFGLAMTYLIGFISSLGFLIKVPAFLDFLAIILFLIFISPKIFSIQTLKRLLIMALGFFTPLLLTALYFFLNGAFLDFLKGAFINNFAYSLSWQTRWLTPNQYLLLKVSVLTAVSFFLFIKRKRLSSQVIFLTLWFSFSLFGANLSSRPYPHYLIQILPSLCLLSAYLLKEKHFRYFLFFIFYFLSIVWYQFGTSYQNPYNYYKNYIFYITNRLSYRQYLMGFDPQTPLTYSLAQFLQIHTLSSEKVFVWSDNSLVYALSQRKPANRYITAYYTESVPDGKLETIAGLKTQKPKFVIITLPRREFKELDRIIKNNYIPVEKTAGAQIYKIK